MALIDDVFAAVFAGHGRRGRSPRRTFYLLMRKQLRRHGIESQGVEVRAVTRAAVPVAEVAALKTARAVGDVGAGAAVGVKGEPLPETDRKGARAPRGGGPIVIVSHQSKWFLIDGKRRVMSAAGPMIDAYICEVA